MIGANQYGSVEYGGGAFFDFISIDLFETVGTADAVEILIPLSLMEVVGASDSMSSAPDQLVLGDSIRVNDWVRLEKKPSNSPFQGE